MKKKIHRVLGLVLFFCCFTSVDAQIKVSQTLATKGPFPLISSNEASGGLKTVANLTERDAILMNRSTEGMIVVVVDADGINAGNQTKTFMFLPDEVWTASSSTIAEAGKSYYWKEISIGIKDPATGGLDSMYVQTLFIDTIYSNLADSIFVLDPLFASSLTVEQLTLGEALVLGVSDDIHLTDRSSNEVVTEHAVGAYVDSIASDLYDSINVSNPAFNANRQITRDGWAGVSYANFQSSSVKEFLEKVFFPVPAPIIQSFVLAGAAPSTIPYSEWKNWNAAPGNINVEFVVENQSKTNSNNGDDIDISTISLYEEDTLSSSIGEVTDLTDYNSGTYIGTDQLAVSLTEDGTHTGVSPWSKALILKVADNYPNVVLDTLQLNLSAADSVRFNSLGLYNSTGASLYGSSLNYIERTGSDITLKLKWDVALNDETLDNMTVESSGLSSVVAEGIPSPAAIGEKDYTISNSQTAPFYFKANVTGSIYLTPSAWRQTKSIQLTDRYYIGSTTVDPALLTEADLSSLSNRLAKNYTASGGGTNSDGAYETVIGSEAYLVYAIPKLSGWSESTFDIELYNAGSWSSAGAGLSTTTIPVTGKGVTEYLIYFVSTPYSGITVESKLVLK